MTASKTSRRFYRLKEYQHNVNSLSQHESYWTLSSSIKTWLPFRVLKFAWGKLSEASRSFLQAEVPNPPRSCDLGGLGTSAWRKQRDASESLPQANFKTPCKRVRHVDIFLWFSQRRHDLSLAHTLQQPVTSICVTTSSVLNLLVVIPASFSSTKWNCAIPLIVTCAFSNTCSRFSNAARSTTKVTVTKDVLIDDWFTASSSAPLMIHFRVFTPFPFRLLPLYRLVPSHGLLYWSSKRWF